MLRRSRGFTIVEIMVALAIGMLISALVVTIFSASARTYRVADSVASLQETGRVAIEAIERDARGAGFRGCNSNNVFASSGQLNVISSPLTYLNDYSASMRGYNNSGASWSPALPAELSGAVPAPKSGTDVVVFRVARGIPIGLSATMASSSANVPLMAAGAFAVDDRVLIADCAQSTVFRISGIAGTNLLHDLTRNSNLDLKRAFGEDAIVMPVQTRAYYIGSSSRNPATERSLWVRTDTGVSQELVENVLDLQIQYGRDTDAVKDWVANSFVQALSTTNWGKNDVVALQISLLLGGSRDNETQAVTQYIYNGQLLTPTDRKLRRVYTATIQLRNRTL